MNPHHNTGYGGGYPQENPPQYDQGEAASYYAGSQQQRQQYQGNPNEQFQQEGQDGERGFLGAVAGGAAGGFGGNKIGGKSGHSTLGTVLGVVAGGIAGHKLQDGVSDWKDKRDEEKEKEKREKEERKRREEEEERRRREEKQQHHRYDGPHNAPAPSHPGHYQQPRSGGVSYEGNFSSSSQDIRLDAHGEYMLRASCRRIDGSYQSSSISLNQHIENDQGSFRWSSGQRRDHSSGPRTVTVQPGDTLRGIAAQVGCGFEEIARHNGIQNPDMIYPGQVLQVPGGSGHAGGSSGGNFGQSARDVRLVDGGRRLEGELLRDGHWVGSSIMLDERISNDNGTLKFL